MTAPSIFLTISFLASQLLHGGLIYTQNSERKSTISRHAAKNNRTFITYIFGHIIAAVSFYAFARTFFAGTPHGTLIITIAGVGAVADIIQAFIPARGRKELVHSVFAYIMAFSVISIGVLASLTIPQPSVIKVITSALALCLVASIPTTLILNKREFWKIQMISLLVFYLEMYVLVFAFK